MNIYYYSKSSGGFYCTEINKNNIPSDAIEITYKKYIELLDGQINDFCIVPDIHGNPILQKE